MIQLREDIAWVASADGRREPFDAKRLAASIHRAAATAGQSDWWLSESIASAVQQYACQVAKSKTIAVTELEDLVAEVLVMLGHAKIAAAFSNNQNRVNVRLDELVAATGGACELELFTRLDTALRPAADERLVSLQICGLRACVLQMRQARRWCDGCRQLAEEIVVHVRARVARIRPAQAVSLNLAVLE
jgi:hypothetical protein